MLGIIYFLGGGGGAGSGQVNSAYYQLDVKWVAA